MFDRHLSQRNRFARRRSSSLAPDPAHFLALVLCLSLSACGGGGSGSDPSSMTPPASASAVNPPPTGSQSPGTNTSTGASTTLPAPVLKFNDTGISLSDGLTRDGKWTVSSFQGLSWEYSLDLGQTWTAGVGDFFVVEGDGPKMIWVRSRDDKGNTSEIVKVSCTLDTMMPAALQVTSSVEAGLRRIDIKGLEAQSRWEYRFDSDGVWTTGTGTQLWLSGNSLARVFTRQLDGAGNSSDSSVTELAQAGGGDWTEFSSDPFAPSVLGAVPPTAHTVILHGSVRDPDKDYLRVDIPAGRRIKSLKLLRYISEDKIAFFAVQRAMVFDAGIDTSRMIAFGHVGPDKLGQNLLANLPASQLSSGSLVIWIQQTGSQVTEYAFALEFASDP